MTRVLVVGPPRSGTTWIGKTLGFADATCYVHEPDGDYEVFALKVKRHFPRHIELEPGDASPGYRDLWAGAFAGGRHGRNFRARVAERLFDGTPRPRRRETRRGGTPPFGLRVSLALAKPLCPDPDAEHVVAKSVQACLSVEWIAAEFEPVVVLVERHPLNVLASWTELGHGLDAVEYAQLRDVARARWGAELPDADAPRLARQAAFLGVLQAALREAARRHPDWIAIRHEDLLVAPREGFEQLTARVGLEFSPAAAAYLDESNQPGEGYATRRVASELAARWRTTLTDDDVALAADALARFPAELGLGVAVDGAAS